MSIYINEEMNPSWGEEEEVTGQQRPVIGAYENGFKDKVIEEAIKAQNRGVKRLTGRERFIALCKKLGLHPSTIKNV